MFFLKVGRMMIARSRKFNLFSCFLLLLFLWHYGSTTLFYHSHLYQGLKIVHSHPFSSSQPVHAHTSWEYWLIDHLSQIQADQLGFLVALAALFLLLLILNTIWHGNFTFCYSGNSRQLRAPPPSSAFAYRL